MARTALKWIFGAILSVVGLFIAGILVIGYLRGINSLGGLISGIVMGSIAFIPGFILLILAIIDVSHNAFDLKVAKILEEYDRITPQALAEKAHANEQRVEKAVSRIISKGYIIVYFDKETGEFVTQEGRAIGERIIGLINSQKRTTVEKLTEETGLTPEEVKRIIVGMEKRGMFNGSYDWKKGKILSEEGSRQLAQAPTKCPNCGGTLPEPPLKGEEVTCEYCGSIVTWK